ncbi:hypothetical protein [Phocaeicola coprocola]|jgi:hypothetical protein|uniref:hypothetical protein n=1 Tax=Phocaeicola coprocola TaxID=310298 RepID=UPI004029B5C5
MNWSIFKYLLTILLAIPVNLLAITDEPQEVSDTKRWDKRIHLRYEGWERMKPTHVKMQYAGGMGVLSTGVGWDYGKRRQWETDVLLGYLPAKYASDFLLTLTVKQNYIPWSMSFDKHWALEPFYCGMYLTTIAGEEFWEKEPGRYPNRYYNFSTKIRPYIFIGQRMNFNLKNSIVQHISLFYEVSTCELYIISKATNRSLTMRDVLRFSFGAKVQLFKNK